MKRAITTCICALMLGGAAVGQNYQIPNSDFEANWTKNQKKGGLTGNKVMYTEMTPDYWHSFYNAKGSVASSAFAIADQTGKLDQIVGWNGTGHAAQIIGRKNFMGTISNGNLTTGIVNMGNITASDQSNYNYSEINNENGHCEFAGIPDSVKIWLKFESQDASKGNASVSMILHTNAEYKDPSGVMGEEAEKAARIAKAYSEIVPNAEWVQYAIPFVYNENDLYKTYTDQKYMLASFSTNKNPGEGTTGDALSVDDIQMVYNSKLASITINGAPLKGFNKDVYSYTIKGRFPLRSDVAVVSDGKGATVEIQEDASGIKIIVTGNDGIENQHVYVLKPSSQINGDFEAWEDCIVWDGVVQQSNVVGKQPIGWVSSNVSQFGFPGELVKLDPVGRTGNAPKITNEFVGFLGLGANAPAFITLGKMWVFPDISAITSSDKDIKAQDLSDGGVIGGTAFTSRPDSLTVYFKRALGTGNPDDDPNINPNEPAKVLIYLWKGTFKSKIIVEHPQNDKKEFIDPVYKDTIDQDRAILGREDAIMVEGGDGVLIGSAEYTIEGAYNEWTRLSIPITYLTDDTPEKMNIVFSAGNYWVRSELGAGNTLWVDDAALVYKAQLKNLTLGGTTIEGFESDVYNYLLPYAEASKELKAEAFGADATISVVEKENTSKRVIKEITVTDNTTQDAQKTYVYTITFQGQKATIALPEQAAHEYVYGDVATLNFTSNNPAEFIYEISDENVVKYDASTKEFKMIGAGSATVTAKQLGDDVFVAATSEPFAVTVSKANLTISFKEGTAWCRRGKAVSWYKDPEERKKMNLGDAEFLIEGLKKGDDLAAAMGDRFISVDAAAGVNEIVGEYRNATLKLGGSGDKNATANYNVEFLPNQKMLIKKTLIKVSAQYAGGRIWGGSGAQEIIIPVGEDASCIRPYYDGFLSGENDAILGSELPVFQCSDITKESPAGTASILTVTLPDESVLPNHELVSNLAENGIVKTAPAPNFSVTEKNLNAAYGGQIELAITKGEGVEHIVEKTSYLTLIGADNVTVTMRKLGTEKLIVYVMATEEFAGKEEIVTINIAKAPLTVKAKDVELPLGSETPKVFAFEFTGFVNGEDSAKVFTSAPTAVLETEIPADAKVGDTFPIVVTPGESDNYELTAVNGTLKIIVGTGIYNGSLSDVIVYSNNGAICVANNDAADMVQVYTVQGLKVYEGTESVITDNIERNTMYIVRIGSYTTKVTVK